MLISGWETLADRPYYDVRAENYGSCRAWIEDDGSSTSADDGSRLPPGSEYGWARKNCMIWGGHCCGGTVEQRNRGVSDMIAFFKKHGF